MKSIISVRNTLAKIQDAAVFLMEDGGLCGETFYPTQTSRNSCH